MTRTKLFTDEEKLLMAKLIDHYKCPSIAKMKFQQVYPDLDPDYSTMTYNAKKWLETGSVARRNKAKSGKNTIDKQIQNIKVSAATSQHLTMKWIKTSSNIQAPLTTSRLQRINTINVSRKTVKKILTSSERKNRLATCQILLDKIRKDGNFALNTLFSGEACFHIDGTVTRQNYEKNRHSTIADINVGNISLKTNMVMVWCGMCNDSIVGPYFFRQSINSNQYLNMLQEYAIPALKRLGLLHQCFFQQDDCDYHYSRKILRYLHSTFPNRWMGRTTSAPIAFPSKSSDLSPLHFYLWNYLKKHVYNHNEHMTVEKLQQQIQSVLESFPKEEMTQITLQYAKRIVKCVEVEGKAFQI